MSKPIDERTVKPTYTFWHDTTALKHSNRRKESTQKRQSRIRRIEENHPCRYYIKDCRKRGVHVYKTIPEKVEPIWEQRWIDVAHTDPETGEQYIYRKTIYIQTGTKVTPKHIVRRRKQIDPLPITPYLKKYHLKLSKGYRKRTSELLRNDPIDTTYSRGGYRKRYDLWWDLW